MKRYETKFLTAALFVVCAAAIASAQPTQPAQPTQGGTQATPQTSGQTGATQATTTQTTGFRADVLREIETTGGRLVQLAEATPADKFSWRPMEGVRSVSEVYMHVAAANYSMLSGLGVEPPAGIDPRNLETITDKARVVEILRQSNAAARQAVLGAPEDMERSVQMFGRPRTTRGVFFSLVNHLHEHLGQSIAYARMNRIVPPWTAERDERRRQQQQQPPQQQRPAQGQQPPQRP